jgi:hypothetical protein
MFPALSLLHITSSMMSINTNTLLDCHYYLFYKFLMIHQKIMWCSWAKLTASMRGILSYLVSFMLQFYFILKNVPSSFTELVAERKLSTRTQHRLQNWTLQGMISEECQRLIVPPYIILEYRQNNRSSQQLLKYLWWEIWWQSPHGYNHTIALHQHTTIFNCHLISNCSYMHRYIYQSVFVIT